MMSNSEERREYEVGPTGEEVGDSYLTVNRRMAELGYDRSAENIYKYPKRHINYSYSDSVSSSDSESEDDPKKKRKWEEFSEKLTRRVLQKQEDLQKKLLEAIDKFERERVAREEEWKTQEMARIKSEHELLLQERLISAAKDAAILAFLQKISEQSKPLHATRGQTQENPTQENPSRDMKAICINERDSGENSSSRWPKEEVEALITIRSALNLGYGKNGTKGPLWQDVSGAMKKIGYDRNAKRCKEKWENINKYYRRVKDSSNKERRIDSKTCPYFHLLDDLYGKRSTRLDCGSNTCVGNFKPEEILMLMMNRDSGSLQEQHVGLRREQEELISVHDQILNADDQVVE